MKKLTDYMAEELSAAFEKAGYDSSYGKVGVSNRPDLCEYQCNGAMAGAKAYKKAPFMIAVVFPVRRIVLDVPLTFFPATLKDFNA